MVRRLARVRRSMHRHTIGSHAFAGMVIVLWRSMGRWRVLLTRMRLLAREWGRGLVSNRRRSTGSATTEKRPVRMTQSRWWVSSVAGSGWNWANRAGRQRDTTLLQFSTKACDFFFVPGWRKGEERIIRMCACVGEEDVLLLHLAMSTFQLIDILLDLVHFLNLTADCEFFGGKLIIVRVT